MEKVKKNGFFRKLKNSIFSFDSYQEFATESWKSGILYGLKLVLIVSGLKIEENKRKEEKMGIKVEHADGEKCERCWMYDEHTEDGLCPRCVKYITKM